MSEAPQELPERGINGRFLPQRSPEREKLRAAIEYLGALDRQLNRLAEARSRLDLHGKERARAAARHALDEARRRAPEVLVAKAMGEPFDPAETVGHAQGLLEDTQRDLDEAAAADELLADEVKAVDGRREIAFYRREAALTEVLKAAPEILALGDRIERTRQQLDDLSWTCSAIGSQRLPFHWDGILWGDDHGSGAPWKAAIAALETDADAPLPNGTNP